MKIFPAIDLRGGAVVRLRHGDPAQQTTFDYEPVAVAQRWADAGARWLHVVNLDGALEDGADATAVNLTQLAQITKVGPQVQFGGGVRSLNDVARALELGVSRVILGTAVIQQPEIAHQAVQRFGTDKIIVGLDARHGRIQIRGWQEDSGQDMVTVGRQIRAAGVEIVLHTDIGRDGDLTGVNGAASSQLARATGLRVIASGGVAGLEDVRHLRSLPGIEGVIIGRALYENKIDLADALREGDVNS